MISANQVADLRSQGESLANHVDVLLTGKIQDVKVGEDTKSSKHKNKDGQEVTTITYIREVKLEIKYTLERARDRSEVGTATRTGNAKDSDTDKGKVKPARDLLRETDVLKDLAQNLAPYTVIETRTLMGDKGDKSDKARGKELNNEMKSASDVVKAKRYRPALDMYLKIYDEYSSFAALYNASVMYEAINDIPKAIETMEKAAKETGDPEAVSEVARLKKIMRDRETIQTVHRDSEGPIEKAIKYASREALKSLPDGARVSFYNNNSNNERDLSSKVIEGMTAAFKQKGGITIVDRENAERIEKELQVQYSGVVSDDNILDVGKQVGANIMITVEIAGVGGNRRLKLTVLDIEQGKK
jgi:tetratricopeptide (TPR) repeat protein